MTSDLSGLRVLVAEHDYFIATHIANGLKRHGATVVGPTGKLSRAHELAQGDVDAAVLDVNLAGENIFAVAKTLTARSIPYVFATGYDRDLIPAPYAVASYIEKPF